MLLSEKCVYAYLNVLYLLQIRTIKVCNISVAAKERDIKEFFSFSGDIKFVEMRRFGNIERLYMQF